jgi:hypothetical protein
VVAGITNNAGHFSLSSSAEMTRIYSNPSMPFDIERGICGPYAGYWATAGWDFCSGGGSLAGTGAVTSATIGASSIFTPHCAVRSQPHVSLRAVATLAYRMPFRYIS